MSGRGGKRPGAGRKPDLPKSLRFIVGARAKTVSEFCEYVPTIKSPEVLDAVRRKQDALNNIELDKRGKWKTDTQRYIEDVLDDYGRISPGRRMTDEEVYEKVAAEFGITTRQVRSAWEWYLSVAYPQVAPEAQACV